MSARRLVLVGGGHAHVEVPRSAARRPFAAELVLVSPHGRQLYSGMMPAQLRGAVDACALTLDLPALCRAAGARFVEGMARRMEASAGGASAVVEGDLGGLVDGDALSLDAGAALAHWGGLTAYGRWAAWLERAVDARFVARYRRLGAGR